MSNELLTLTEEIVRDRVNLQHDHLEDVKSLSLPGTYHEKIVELGTSLKKFSRLKCLDLSRNSLASLKGLEHLKLLEKLNLYYNAIDSMEELKRLKYNPNLKELDLRLNPVTRSEPDYRLYLIHMLPNLQSLDDRGVRDRERQAALVHFSSSQATEMTQRQAVEETIERPTNPRADMVKGLNKGMTALDDDDVAVLDLIARTGGDLSQPPKVSGSGAKEAQAEEYTLEVLKSLENLAEKTRNEKQSKPEKTVAPPGSMEEAYSRKYPNIPTVMVSCDDNRKIRQDENLQYTDEHEAYSKFKSHGYFTPHPNSEPCQQSKMHGSQSEILTERDPYPAAPKVPTERRRSFGEEEGSNDRHRRSNSQPTPSRLQCVGCLDDLVERKELNAVPETTQNVRTGLLKGENSRSREVLGRIMDYVDRYWNGTKSLHKNIKFKGLAYELLDGYVRNYVGTAGNMQEEITSLQEENLRLRKREELTKNTLADSTLNESQLKASLKQAYKENEELKEQLHRVSKENRNLQHKLNDTEIHERTSALGAGMSLTSVNASQIDEIQRQNEKLKSDVVGLQIKLKQFEQMKELASMLQESHKSLVQTNEHLLKDLSDTKKRHQHEVEQLNWSYNQLKNSVNMSRLRDSNN